MVNYGLRGTFEALGAHHDPTAVKENFRRFAALKIVRPKFGSSSEPTFGQVLFNPRL